MKSYVYKPFNGNAVQKDKCHQIGGSYMLVVVVSTKSEMIFSLNRS